MLKILDHMSILKRIDRFASSFTQILTMEELAIKVDEVLDDLMELEYSGLYLYDFREERLRLMIAKSFTDEEKKEAERTAMERHPGYVFRTGKIINIPDTENDPDKLTSSSLRRFKVKSRLYMPVFNGDAIVGVFGIVSSKKTVYTEDQIIILSFVCNIAGGIYGNIMNQAELRKTSLIAQETDNAVVITDHEGKTEWINRSFELITGFSFAEMKGKRPGDVLQGPETDPEIIRDLAIAIEEHRPVEKDLINYRKDGTAYWVRLQIQPIFNKKGELTNFISIQRDISEQKKIEHDLIRAKAEAEAATAAKSLFLANMSHEIRTPLNAVIGLSRLMKSTKLNPEQKNLNEKLLISGENLLGIINEILDFSKIEAGKVELETTPFHLQDTLDRVYRFQEHAAEEKMLYLTTFLDPEIQKPVKGDPVRLQQVLINLVNNAIKFTPSGSVIVRCELMEATEQDYLLKFSVTDTGIGISKDKLDAIFEKFNQEDESVTRVYGGTGLGLAISRQLVHLMGGKLQLESEKGKGSTFFFTIRLPLSDSDALREKNIKIRINPDVLKDKRLLVVEDNEFNQFIAKSILEKWNALVTLAENGQIAINLLQSNQYDLIFMDMQMPVLDGCTATRQIRDNLKVTTPIIALTAFATQDAIRKALDSGMNSYITKPFEEEVLYAQILRYLDIPPEYLTEPEESASVRDEEPAEHKILYDLNNLSRLLNNDTREIITMIEKFIEFTPAYVEEVLQASRSGNLEALAIASHKMKSSIDHFASNNLKSNIRMIHEYAKTHSNTDRIPKLINYFEQSMPLLINQLMAKKEDLRRIGR